jgi:hypothetical protein
MPAQLRFELPKTAERPNLLDVHNCRKHLRDYHHGWARVGRPLKPHHQLSAIPRAAGRQVKLVKSSRPARCTGLCGVTFNYKKLQGTVRCIQDQRTRFTRVISGQVRFELDQEPCSARLCGQPKLVHSSDR